MTKEYPWMLGPFEKAAEANPCLVPNTVSRFFCPVQEKELGWEAKDVFNPAACLQKSLYPKGNKPGVCDIGMPRPNTGNARISIIQGILNAAFVLRP